MLKSLLALSNHNINLKNKIVFAAVLIFLVALIAYIIQQHYLQSYRDSLTPVDFLTLLTELDFDFVKHSFLHDRIMREVILDSSTPHL